MFEVNAAALRECNEFGNDFHLDGGEDDRGKSPTSAIVNINYATLPHKQNEKKGTVTFTNPTDVAWLESLENALGEGACVHL